MPNKEPVRIETADRTHDEEQSVVAPAPASSPSPESVDKTAPDVEVERVLPENLSVLIVEDDTILRVSSFTQSATPSEVYAMPNVQSYFASCLVSRNE